MHHILLISACLFAVPAGASGGPAAHGDAHGSDPHDAVAEAHTGAPAKSSSAKTKSTPKAAPKATPTQHDVHWTYDGEHGPDHWGELSPEWAKCSTGHSQTPIDINTNHADAIGLDDVVFHYHPLQSKILNNGHTIQVNMPEGDAIEVDGDYYELAQFHFHSPSEHRLNGQQFPMELHLVHKNSKGNLAVVGIFLEEGPETSALAPVFSSMSLKAGQEKPISVPLDASGFIPADHELLRYSGSLTTPPCSEGVRWVVFTHAVSVSAAQMAAFRTLYENNARPIQALNSRPLLQDVTH